MAIEITIPRLGWSMEEGAFVRWLKKDGDFVQVGDAIFELEGEKAAQDIEAVDSGILRIPSDAPKPGTIVAVGAVIGFLVDEGEATPAGRIENGAVVQPSTATTTADESNANVSHAVAADSSVADDLPTTASNGTLCSRSNNEVIASPRARRVADELGVDWHRLVGTGRDGRVRESDVRNAASRPQSGSTVVPVSSRRRTIANRMLASHERTAPVTLTTRVDATNLVNLRNQFKNAVNDSAIPSYLDIVIKLVTQALQQHPMLAAREEGDHWIVPSSSADFHVGFAVDTDDGLVVPVIHQAGNLGLFDLANRSAALVEKSRSGRLAVSEMQGGVFTVTNLGGFGIEGFTPIINVPESAVLGRGRIGREPVVIDGQIVVRDQMTLSLTFDHRIVDGAPAARFLQTVSQAIENPSAWLLRDIR